MVLFSERALQGSAGKDGTNILRVLFVLRRNMLKVGMNQCPCTYRNTDSDTILAET